MRVARLSHLEIVVGEIEPMEHFYTQSLGFEVTDRSAHRGDGEMVFLSQDPNEHHQTNRKKRDMPRATQVGRCRRRSTPSAVVSPSVSS